ncbi:MAG TPA: hypothetical protein VHQ41_01320 [Patescibacteria group bacterium]|jgi:hypothetical protein|nr:hypothetical protein [Patescibacteria group bacterium]
MNIGFFKRVPGRSDVVISGSEVLFLTEDIDPDNPPIGEVKIKQKMYAAQASTSFGSDMARIVHHYPYSSRFV